MNRLEARQSALSMAMDSAGIGAHPHHIVERAAVFEKYLWEGTVPDGDPATKADVGTMSSE